MKPNMKAIKLLIKPIPIFLTADWANYLMACSECIEQKLLGYTLLKDKLERAGYAVGKDGTVYPF